MKRLLKKLPRKLRPQKPVPTPPLKALKLPLLAPKPLPLAPKPLPLLRPLTPLLLRPPTLLLLRPLLLRLKKPRSKSQPFGAMTETKEAVFLREGRLFSFRGRWDLPVDGEYGAFG